ncbi:hypothetical protein L3Q82_010715 [Scortum barcoo]|uniref:Uncharacterized protein n=1 Tax=Scortum barcoo TaxID=214431 RepID=A0ACB8WCK7_9TELE|nr:hypothetical protein L3Q82_010715 [Scortum barcoo]
MNDCSKIFLIHSQSITPLSLCFVLARQISDPPCRPEKTCEAVGEEDLGPEERRVLERKMKKILKKEEKKRLKAEGETVQKTEASGPTAAQQALDYLTCCSQIPDKKFALLLQYLEGLRGGAKDTTVKKALALIEESGQAPEDKVAQQRAHRAREVIQMLS